LVTGGSRGIGRAIALALAGDGVDVGVMSRSHAASEEVAELCRAQGVKSVALEADVTDSAALERAVMGGTRELGGVDIVVTSAGVAWLGPTQRAQEDTWSTMIDVNLVGTMEMVRLTLPQVRQSAAGAYIFIGSISSKITYAGGAGYCASKHALLGFAGALYDELRVNRIKVSTVCPGTVDTDMTRNSGYSVDSAALLTADDVASAAMFCARSPARSCPTELVIRCHHPSIV